MKRLMAIYLAAALFFVLPFSIAFSDEEGYQYLCRADAEFSLRQTPGNDGRKIGKVPKGDYLTVLEYGQEWSKVAYEGETGYAKSQWLYMFKSTDPYLYPVPNYEAPYGLGVMLEEVKTKGKAKISGYEAIVLQKGQTVTVQRYNEETGVATVLIWRSFVDLPADALEVTPFVPYETAELGDVIGGYTTFMPRDYGAPYSDNRRYNLLKAMELINCAVVYPGDLFSFNDLAGGFVKDGEYKVAKIVGGEGVGHGGGVCQISVLIFSAALMLPFKIESWGMHTANGLSYTLRECDATVSSTRDMSFYNLLDYAVELQFDHNEAQTSYTVLVIRAE